MKIPTYSDERGWEASGMVCGLPAVMARKDTDGTVYHFCYECGVL